jgi:putative intracellular protease/amidase
MQIGMLVFPGIDPMDLSGPFEVLARLPDAKVLLNNNLYRS